MKKGKIRKNNEGKNLMYTYSVEWLGKKGETHNMDCKTKFFNYETAYNDSVRFIKEAKVETGKIIINYGKFIVDEIPVILP